MPSFHYQVRDTGGKLLEGDLEAQDEREFRHKIDDMHCFLIDYRAASAAKRSGLGLNGFGHRIGLKELSIFSWQLYTMVNAGLPLIECLKSTVKQTKQPQFRHALEEITKKVEQGSSFSDALKSQSKTFAPMYVHMVKAGEVGGVLDEMIRRLAIFLDRQAQIQGKIKSAMAYPMILATASVVVAIFLVAFVLPRFVGMFAQMGAQLPLPTAMLLGLSGILRTYWYLILLVIGALVAAFQWYVRTPFGRLTVDRLGLRLPVIGPLQTKVVTARFSQTLSILTTSGIPILTGLEIAKLTAGNAHVAKGLDEVMAEVAKGSSIAAPIERLNLFPEMVVNMIKVGEDTGALDKMLERVTDFYERDVNEAIELFTKLIESVFMMVMTVVIGFIAVSIFLPMASIMEHVG